VSEAELIDDIWRAFGPLVAPGAYDFVDDAAMIPPLLTSSAGERARVITTDVVVEGVDFDRALYPLVYAGFRALAQNLSDVASMGAVPTGFVWSLALPPTWSRDDVGELARGAAILAKLRKVPLFGGDLSSMPAGSSASIAITAFGDVTGLPIRRSTALVDDDVFLLAPNALGASAAGLRLLRARPSSAPFDAWLRALAVDEAACVSAHIKPLPADGALLVHARASACIDLSDGLAKDADRLARASGVSLALDGTALASVTAAGATRDEALHGGEDYALVFTSSSRAAAERVGAVHIGRARAGQGVLVDDAPLAPQGFDHFP
jgi:thiamine-monophosphate kinase